MAHFIVISAARIVRPRDNHPMPGSRRGARIVFFGFTIFLSSFLLFLIQPVFAKLILPWFGGSAAVWTVCLVFFQTFLLLGYLYAHLISRWLAPVQQAMLHIGLLLCAVATLPVIPGPSWKDLGTHDPTGRILLLLIAVLGLPYLMLSATGPLVQSWYARLWPDTNPYRLFALSNAASLLALAAYPFLIEPRFPTQRQAVLWSMAFGVFALLCSAAAWIARSSAAPPVDAPAPAPLRTRLLWIALAATGSMALVATTNQITENVAAVPFLWILPLALYLLTFIVTFENPRWYRRQLVTRLLAVALCSVAYATYDIQMADAIIVSLPLFCVSLFIVCFYCHGELSLLKPAAGGLTGFYLNVALGGAIGAVLAGLVAPHVFSGVYELPLALIAVAVLAMILTWPEGWIYRVSWIAVAAVMTVSLGWIVFGYHSGALVMTRSFYGALRVTQTGDLRKLFHGTVRHGAEFMTPTRRREPTSYFGPLSGAGLALRFCCDGPKRVGIIGLGTGTLAAFGQSGDFFHFYEINPQMIALAKSQFAFLSDSPAKIEITQGDARLSLENEPPQHYDVLIADAFSGDAIPVHLLTREAFQVYLRHLKPEGVLAFHVSNQFLDLSPVIASIGAELGENVAQVVSFGDEAHAIVPATWILMTKNKVFMARPEIVRAIAPVPLNPSLRMWTDDYNNLFDVLRIKP